MDRNLVFPVILMVLLRFSRLNRSGFAVSNLLTSTARACPAAKNTSFFGRERLSIRPDDNFVGVQLALVNFMVRQCSEMACQTVILPKLSTRFLHGF